MSDRSKYLTFFCVLAISLVVRFLQLGTVRYNYFYMNALNFSGHEIETAEPGKGIVLLGNSAVAGNNVPLGSTIADHLNRQLNDRAYNLGNFEQSLLETALYLDLAARFSPPLVVVGVNPASFNGGGAEDLTIAYEDRLPSILPHGLADKVRRENHAKNDPFPRLKKNLPTTIPSPLQLVFQDKVHRLRTSLLGSLYSASIDPSRMPNFDGIPLAHLDATIAAARRMKSVPVIFFSPIHEKERIYPREAYARYKARVSSHLQALGVVTFDYDDLLPSSHDYFIDFIHPTEKGNGIIAEKLLEDLRSHDLL